MRGKSDLRYWFENGLYKEKGVPHWYCRFMHKGRREFFPLGTPNRQEAANKARSIYRKVVAEGWEAALAEFRPEYPGAADGIVTVGAFLSALERLSDIPAERLEGYAMPLRSIVARVADIPKGGRGGNRQAAFEWRSTVHNVPLSVLTPVAVTKWKKDFLRGYPSDPLSQRTAKISVNSLLKRAKSLFAEKYLKQLGTRNLQNPFAEVQNEKRQNQRYQSTFNISSLIRAAKDELGEPEPEMFKIFLLASMAGLRRKEIDCLLWDQVKFDTGIIRIEPTKYYHPKSEDSIRDIDVESEFLAVLREMRNGTLFVIESSAEPQSASYRCDYIFKKFIRWLKMHGVQGSKPLHQLRKEFGSLLNDQHGIYVASRMLGHSDISVTASHYLDKKQRKTVGLGSQLVSS
jgi:integrase